MWQQRQSADSDFCRALVSNGYLTEAQMQHAAQRYRLGVSRDGGVIFWQIDTMGRIFDGKIMYYRPDCHRDHQRQPLPCQSAGDSQNLRCLIESPETTTLCRPLHLRGLLH